MTEETKSAEMKRKASKPIMEKKRRARINDSLQELKVLILEASKKDVSCHSKLEKADILEMTVQYLKNLKNNPITDNSKGDPLANYRAGFNECATEISRYLASTNGLGVDLKARLLEHLAVQYHAAVAAETAGSAIQKPPLGVPCLPSMPRRAIPPSSPSLFSLLQQQQDSHIFGHSSQFQLLSAANLPDGKVAAILVPAASPLFMTTSVPPIHQELFPVLCKDPMVGSAPGSVPKVPLSLGAGSTFWRPF